MKDLYDKNFKSLKKEIKEDLGRWKDLPYSWIGRINRVKPKHFILFVTILKGVISLISFSACLSFEHRNAIDLFELILYAVTLLTLSVVGVFW